MNKVKVGKVIGIVFFTLIVFGIAYLSTYYVDKWRRDGLTTDIKVLFDDAKEFSLENTEVLTKEEALLEWPYIFTIENAGKEKGIYQLVIEDNSDSDIIRDNLSYVLMLDDKEIKSGNLDKISDDILHENSIDASKKQNYKLYIYKDKEDEGTVYKYAIKVNAILDGGPGF